MSNSVLDPEDLSALENIVTHVFCPLQLPDGDDHSLNSDRSLAGAIAAVARLYTDHVEQANIPLWHSILRMLDNLRAIVQFQSLDRSQTISQLGSMGVGDIVAFLIRAQNVAVVLRKQKDNTIFESFEVSPKAENVMTTQEKLVCSYPGPAIEIPNVVFDNNFRTELASFLVHMNNDILPDAAPATQKAQSTVIETRDTTHPRYITELLTGILRSVGRPADVVRITKRVGDDVVWNNSELPWRRSSLWLLIRVVLQTSLDRSPLGRVAYKQFMLFFVCCLGKEHICENLSNDLLHFMSAKISRRLRKLGSSAPDWLSRIVLETCTSLRSTLEKRWIQVQAAQSVSLPWTPSELDLNRDIQLSLLDSDEYIRNRLTNQNVYTLATGFSPRHQLRGNLEDFLSSDRAFFEGAYNSDPHVALYDVEQAVEKGIDGWVDRVTNNDEACVKLEILANKYSSSALKTYGKNPELVSIMLLTTIELWVALDKLAIREIPLLTEYSPEVPTSLLEDLLLCKAASLHRLRCAHRYLSHRHSQSNRGSVFSRENTFALQYYRGSSHLQHLKARIEEVAQREVGEKIAELNEKNTRHTELKEQAASIEHSYNTDWRGWTYHSSYCRKCDLESQQNMNIAVHEWPLPANLFQAQVVVFELDCPVSFNMWRTATFHLLVDLCSPSLEPKDPYIKLDQYHALQPYLIQHPRSRITLGSETKPFVVSHYSTVSIPDTQERICVNNGLNLSSFDSHAHIPVSWALSRVNVRGHCTYQLESGPYQQLQKCVDCTSHSSNEVLANQADCHNDLSIHEYMAFVHLRCGGRLQWLNILRELRARAMSFRRHEVHFLLAQAVSQVGPLGSSGWDWHREIQEPSFCDALLAELGSLVQDVGANWLEGVTMDSVSFLLRRLLASSPDQVISLKALGLLCSVRTKVFKWVKELSDKLAKSPGDEEFRGFLRDSAAICRSTFDVDPPMIHSLLRSAGNMDALVFCAILIHDHTPSNISCLPAYSQLLLDRDRRLSLALESVINDLIQADSNDQGINLAISRFWNGYRAGSKWTPLENPNSRWLLSRTASTAEQCSQEVHFNLLDGSLLVDGKPLGRLPTEILQHPLYNLIFSEYVLDIIPGDLPGMDYVTKGMISDHQVYFSLRNSDLVIQAKRKLPTDDSETMVLIPQDKLKGDLPAVLITGHAHWLNLSTSVMEIRSLDTIWEASLENWKIDCTPGQYRMHKGHEVLVDIRSRSWAMVSGLLAPLDTSRNLIVTVFSIDSDHSSLSKQLSVVLPRYGLSFYVDDGGELQSRNIRGMVYDENQSIGTLFGLVNRLVLKPKIKDVDVVELIPRCVLIPEGNVSFQKVGHHVRVEIDTHRPDLGRVTYQTYRIDTDLGCLATVSLTNKLYCAYLHALTSGCGTDPLTGRSGTEEALSLLWSASCWSIMKLTSRDAELLSLIASVCPSRAWYPVHRQCMQKVEWLNLPANSQHHELYIVAKGIKGHYERLRSFHDSENQSNNLFRDFPSQNNHLLERSARRTVHIFPPDFSLQPSQENRCDVRYPARDLVEYDSGEHRAYVAAIMVRQRTANGGTTKDMLSMVESWTKTISGVDVNLSLQYDRSWLAPDLPSIWIKAYNLLRRGNEEKWTQLLFSLPAMAYASPEFSDLVSVLVAFASHPQFEYEHPPHYDSYNILDAYYPSGATLRSFIVNCAHSFWRSPESSGSARYNECYDDMIRRQQRTYDTRLDLDVNDSVNRLFRAWPCETPPGCSLDRNSYDVASLTTNVQCHFSSRFRNMKLKEHLIRVQEILRNVQASPTDTLRYSFYPSHSTPPHNPWTLTADQLFCRPHSSLQERGKFPRYVADIGNTNLPGSGPLHQLISTAEAHAKTPFHHRYVLALRDSAECFRSEMSLVSHGGTKLPDARIFTEHYARCRADYIAGLHHLQQQLSPRSQSEHALEQSGQWPRIPPRVLLRFLASNSPITLSDDWKRCLIKLALLVLELQRSRRLLRLYLDNHLEDLRKELQNEGCDGWNSDMHPDWLLIQLQSNFFVRRVQADVAHEMISPHSGDNTAMQLNMGEGKSSVIVPIVVAVLADGDQLVRVIVPKALTAQMFHLLVDRLGGLANRRIYFLPFARSVEVNHQKATALREIMSECMKERGILVIQPEHILSLKLVSVEKQLQLLDEKDAGLGLPLLELQRWLHSRSRDILDESDEILHVRYQLVYTIGNQQHMQGFPERWTTTQQILSLVKKHASSLRVLFPLGVECDSRLRSSGSFPHLRILHADAGQKLISCVVKDIVDDFLPNFSFARLPSDLKRTIGCFISCEHVPPEEFKMVKEYTRESSLWGGLLLLRGLLATGILLFAFKERRWRVDYGLAPARSMLAVPYRAKDVPAQRAEFGHPDVAIILTCLSYYYGGLDPEQLKVSFELLLSQDDPSVDYDLWVRECSPVPEFLRTLSGVNIKSSEQWRDHLVPFFSRNKATIDFYLSKVVFPKEAKEFPLKLSCSGWDLAEKREHLLTGFSGTNDGQYLLPLHITQRDPDHQRGTNAKVLSYLLQPENRDYMCMSHDNGERRTTHEFLKILISQTPEIRVLLDVGAQMLELQNSQLAQAWLNLRPDASAAIYFNEDDELTVVTRDGNAQLLQSSPFAQQLDQCVVYLDDAHTRGTDIKFPARFRAAVTLGPKVTKDRLTQGCMRMRKLGHGHSIMFFAPLEIDRQIRFVAAKGSKKNINTMDILHWAIRETCDDILQRAPHWVQQGMDHTSRYDAWSGFCQEQLTPEELSAKWLQPEAKTLEDLYGPNTSNGTLPLTPAIRQRCDELGILSLRNVSMDEEQEREVVHEAERERQVQRPPRVPKAIHSIHPDVTSFVRTGVIPTYSAAFRPVFETLRETSAATNEAHVWSSHVLATRDFEKTVQSSSNLDDYLRPVQWIVSGQMTDKEVLVILSPHEVNHLIPDIRSSDNVHLHLYTPRIIKSMKPCDDLALYSIPMVPTGWTAPSLLMDQLNAFSGQLYLQDYETYIRLCRFLCAYARYPECEGIEGGHDGFIAPRDRPRHWQNLDTFQSSPLVSLKTLTRLRRKGTCFALTHMGKLVDGRLLSEDDFRDGSDANVEDESTTQWPPIGGLTDVFLYAVYAGLECLRVLLTQY